MSSKANFILIPFYINICCNLKLYCPYFSNIMVLPNTIMSLHCFLFLMLQSIKSSESTYFRSYFIRVCMRLKHWLNEFNYYLVLAFFCQFIRALKIFIWWYCFFYNDNISNCSNSPLKRKRWGERERKCDSQERDGRIVVDQNMTKYC